MNDLLQSIAHKATHFDQLDVDKGLFRLGATLDRFRCRSLTDPICASRRSTLCRSISLSGVAAPRLFHSFHTSELLRYHFRTSASALCLSPAKNERLKAISRCTLPRLS